MANAGHDDVDRALAAAGVPAMRYFNFRNLRFVRGPATDPVETFGVNADDHDLHVIRPPGIDAQQDASPEHQPQFGDDPILANPHHAPSLEPIAVPGVAIEPDRSEAAAWDAEPAHAIAEPEPVAPEPVVAKQAEAPPPVLAFEPPQAIEPPIAAKIEPPPAEIPVVPPKMTAPPIVAPPVVEPPVAKVEPPPPTPPAPPPVREPPSAKVVETEAPVFELEPTPVVAAPVVVVPVVAVAETKPAGSATVERESLAQMFTALADRADRAEPRAATWGTPEPSPKRSAPGSEVAPAPAQNAIGRVPEFRMPEFRMSDVRNAGRTPAAPSRAAAAPALAAPAVFSLAERLSARPGAPAPSRLDGQGFGLGGGSPRVVTERPPARPRSSPSPFERPAPRSAAAEVPTVEVPTAEAMFRRL